MCSLQMPIGSSASPSSAASTPSAPPANPPARILVLPTMLLGASTLINRDRDGSFAQHFRTSNEDRRFANLLRPSPCTGDIAWNGVLADMKSIVVDTPQMESYIQWIRRVNAWHDVRAERIKQLREIWDALRERANASSSLFAAPTPSSSAAPASSSSASSGSAPAASSDPSAPRSFTSQHLVDLLADVRMYQYVARRWKERNAGWVRDTTNTSQANIVLQTKLEQTNVSSKVESMS